MTSPPSASGIPLYLPSFPKLFNNNISLNDVEEEDAYANDDKRDAFRLAGLRRSSQVDPYNPYAEPPGPSSIPEERHGPSIDPIFERLLPSAGVRCEVICIKMVPELIILRFPDIIVRILCGSTSTKISGCCTFSFVFGGVIGHVHSGNSIFSDNQGMSVLNRTSGRETH